MSSSSVGIIIGVRKQSTRCKNKVLRDFYKGKSLTEITLEKLRGRKDVYVAAHEDEFKDLAEKYEVNFVRRTLESALGETPEVMDSYLHELDFTDVITVNVCCPFTKVETIERAIKVYKEKKLKSLMAIVSTHEIIYDNNLKPLNPDAHILNSKMRKPMYVSANNFVMFNVERFWSIGGGVFERFAENDPYLLPVDYNESLDIDTEEQFQVVRAVYAYQHESGSTI